MPSFLLFQHGYPSIGWINNVFIQCSATMEFNELELYLYTYTSYINMDKSQHWRKAIAEYEPHNAVYMKFKETNQYY